MSRRRPLLLALVLALVLALGLAPRPAAAACEDLAGTRYYGACVSQAREREARGLEDARRQEQRLQDVERRQQVIDDRMRELDRERRLDEMRDRYRPLH